MDPQQVKRDADGVMRCGECGFAYGLDPKEVAKRAGSGLEAVRRAVAGVPEALRNRRPSPAVWSVNAYTAHLADTAEVIDWRVRRVAEQDRPLLPNHDQDEAVERSRADERSVEESLALLERRVRAFQEYVEKLAADAWGRVGVHSRAGEVRLSDVAHDMPHELEHHAGDIRRVGEQVGG